MWFSRAVIGLFALGGLAIALIFVFEGGNTAGRIKTTATVDDCHYVPSNGHASGYEQCTGHWRFKGHTVRGDINGTDVKDMFDRVTVYANDHVAHTPHGIEWIDVIAGLAMFAFGAWGWIRNEREIRRRRSAANPSGLSPA